MAKTEQMFLLQCEKIVNETWSKASLHIQELQRIIESGEIVDEIDEAIVLIAANAALQKMTVDKTLDKQYFNMLDEKSPCGINLKKECPCDRKVCLLDQPEN